MSITETITSPNFVSDLEVSKDLGAFANRLHGEEDPTGSKLIFVGAGFSDQAKACPVYDAGPFSFEVEFQEVES